MKRLVVFFSRRGENYAVGNINEGNAEHIAKVIQKLTNVEIFEIKPKEEYPSNYSACTKVALKGIEMMLDWNYSTISILVNMK